MATTLWGTMDSMGIASEADAPPVITGRLTLELWLAVGSGVGREEVVGLGVVEGG